MSIGNLGKTLHSHYSLIYWCQIGDDCVLINHAFKAHSALSGNKVVFVAYRLSPVEALFGKQLTLVVFTAYDEFELKHGSYARTEPFPCLHQECPCTFKSLNALKVHLSRIHTRTPDQQQQSVDVAVQFCCLSCGFAQTCSETDNFTHLRTPHLKVNHKVRCPYKDCNFETSIYSTFKAHESKVHREQNWKRFKSEIIGLDNVSNDSDAAQDQISHADDMEELEDVSEEASENDLRDLEKQLQHT
ncbi:hypothetical protein F2P81_023425 [Scophthalmus maximus]|uniref:C2H2-type domain-containing protein n=1 Tax=Scophthalmus maximus TaxID=52904 RepID=A0A6A4RRH4_SCOMX|nr:hypothetical protein F2P81_023425 [Scophthalmus maximus]